MPEQSTVTPKIKFDTQQSMPIASFMLVFVCGTVYVMAASTGPHIETWIANHGLIGAHAVKGVNETMSYLKMAMTGNMAAFAPVQKNIADFFTFCFNNTFASLDLTQVAVNCFFLWAFGASMEQRLGFARFLGLAMLGATLPWAGLYYEAVTRDPNHCYYGPFFLFCILVGASFVFPPEKKINAEWFKSTRGNIFAKKVEEDYTTRYQFKPMLFLVLFILYEAGMYFWVGKSYPILKNASILSGIASIFLGYISVSLMVWSATGSLKDGPIRLMCVKMYNDILRLDVGHETAVKGTSHALGLPPERVKEWVAKQKGKMRVS
jgi:hypothetical protein